MLGGKLRRVVPLAAAAVTLLGASGCQLVDDGDNLVAGKQVFVQKCGSCHTLNRAGTTGVTGPNLDEAFQQARADGFGESTFAGVVERQIHNPARSRQLDPKTGKRGDYMPDSKELKVSDEAAQDIAAYVAGAVARSGEDNGLLATVGVKRSTKVAKADDGALDIPADPSGALAYVFGGAEAQAGTLALNSKNPSAIDHNIAVEGGGQDIKGPVVKDGGVSTVEFDAEPGEYTFYCSVPGHREGGMLGKLTVK
jgi:mono/diheme cytochrome c family protein